ncbi:hypothetical protein FRB99_008361 [Tulasnella sp. 403]|nr:hypothetical protein FRB99_008361 [Tulasnella sp. 403]
MTGTDGTGKSVAVKVLNHPADSNYEEQKTEILGQAKLLKPLEHANILEFIGIGEDLRGGNLYLVSPWMRNGSLRTYLTEKSDVSRPPFLLQTASALAYLHENKIIHGEINASNILVSSDTEPKALLSGFSLSRKVDDITTPGLRAGGGAVRWQAPELWNGNAHKSFKTDTYAFGMTIYEVLTGKVPFHQHLTHSVLLKSICTEKERPQRDSKNCPAGESWGYLWETAERCWHTDAGDRPSMKTVHGWLVNKKVDEGDTSRPTPDTTTLDLGGATPGPASPSRSPPTPKTTMGSN